jgi:hypothetical protein
MTLAGPVACIQRQLTNRAVDSAVIATTDAHPELAEHASHRLGRFNRGTNGRVVLRLSLHLNP